MSRIDSLVPFAVLAGTAYVADAAGSSMMLVAGVTSKTELCMTASKGVATLEGRELWQFQSGGQLVHEMTKECLGVSQAGVGSEVLPMSCGSAGVWETTPNGQLKTGDLCLSQVGSGSGVVDLALKAAVGASSTFDPIAHGAWAAVDGSGASYWASRVDEPSPVTLAVDLGSKQALSALKIAWEFPARSFSVEVSADGAVWEEVAATTTNVVKTSEVPLTGKYASKVRLVMKEAAVQPILGGEHSLYGIKSLRVAGPALRPVLEDCSVASKSLDARDKYFLVSVSTYDPAGFQAWQAQQPSLEAAAASLSSAVSELQDVIPGLDMCKRSAVSFAELTRSKGQTRRNQAGRAVGLSDASLKELLGTAKDAVLAVRSKLI